MYVDGCAHDTSTRRNCTRSACSTRYSVMKAAYSKQTEHRTREVEAQETRRKKKRKSKKRKDSKKPISTVLRRYSETYFTSLCLIVVALKLAAYAVSLSLANGTCRHVHLHNVYKLTGCIISVILFKAVAPVPVQVPGTQVKNTGTHGER